MFFADEHGVAEGRAKQKMSWNFTEVARKNELTMLGWPSETCPIFPHNNAFRPEKTTQPQFKKLYELAVKGKLFFKPWTAGGSILLVYLSILSFINFTYTLQNKRLCRRIALNMVKFLF